MTFIIDVIPFFTILFENPYLNSCLGLVAFAFVVLAFKILSNH